MARWLRVVANIAAIPIAPLLLFISAPLIVAVLCGRFLVAVVLAAGCNPIHAAKLLRLVCHEVAWYLARVPLFARVLFYYCFVASQREGATRRVGYTTSRAGMGNESMSEKPVFLDVYDHRQKDAERASVSRVTSQNVSPLDARSSPNDHFGTLSADTSVSSRQSTPSPEPLRPVVVFIYGGAWYSGRRWVYARLAAALRDACDAVVVVPDYVGYPHEPIVGAAAQVAAAVRWTHDHIFSYGGDPRRIVLVGHSAGAHLVALLGSLQLLDDAAAPRPVSTHRVAGEGGDAPRDDSRSSDSAVTDAAAFAELLREVKERAVRQTTAVVEDDPTVVALRSLDPPSAVPRGDELGSIPPLPAYALLASSLRLRDTVSATASADNQLHALLRAVRGNGGLPAVRGVVLLCGVYNLAQHLSWERRRVVHRVSPMAWAAQGLWGALSPLNVVRRAASIRQAGRDDGAIGGAPSEAPRDDSGQSHRRNGGRSARAGGHYCWMRRVVVAHSDHDETVSSAQSQSFCDALRALSEAQGDHARGGPPPVASVQWIPMLNCTHSGVVLESRPGRWGGSIVDTASVVSSVVKQWC